MVQLLIDYISDTEITTCLNDGVYDEETNVCSCSEPYFGTACELECQNEGTIDVDTDTCLCAEGYIGSECGRMSILEWKIYISQSNIYHLKCTHFLSYVFLRITIVLVLSYCCKQGGTWHV